MSGYTPRDKKRERVYSVAQQKILDTVWDYGGDAIRAAKAAGLSNPYATVKSLSDELIQMAEEAMARLSLKSVKTIEDVLDSDGDVKQANERLKAAQLILDRTNPRVDKVEISGEAQRIFILPEKKPLDEQD